ncbi:MAG: hypothetical protein HKN23_03320, partial [Verrucomicrobiales bacterium]|nr:hypothetical protein [Verrucomicrobiales bacterium]
MNLNWNPADSPAWCRLCGPLPTAKRSVIVLVDDSPSKLSAFFNQEIDTLPDEFRIVRFSPRDDGQKPLQSLRDHLIELFPEVDPKRFSLTTPFGWIGAVRRVMRSGVEIRNRWLIVNQFHRTLELSQSEQRAFTRVLQAMARVPGFGVIVGIPTESAWRIAALMEMAEDSGSVLTRDRSQPEHSSDWEAAPVEPVGSGKSGFLNGKVALTAIGMAMVGLTVGVLLPIFSRMGQTGNEPETPDLAMKEVAPVGRETAEKAEKAEKAAEVPAEELDPGKSGAFDTRFVVAVSTLTGESVDRSDSPLAPAIIRSPSEIGGDIGEDLIAETLGSAIPRPVLE